MTFELLCSEWQVEVGGAFIGTAGLSLAGFSCDVSVAGGAPPEPTRAWSRS